MREENRRNIEKRKEQTVAYTATANVSVGAQSTPEELVGSYNM